MTGVLRHLHELLLVLLLTVGVVLVVGSLGGQAETLQQARTLRLTGAAVLALVVLGGFWVHRRLILQSLMDVHHRLESIRDGQSEGEYIVEDGAERGPAGEPIGQTLADLERQVESLRSRNCSLEIRSRIHTLQHQQTMDILSAVSDAVLVTNRFDELVFANRAAEQCFGFVLANAHRQNIDHVIKDGALVRLIRDVRRQGRLQSMRVVEHTTRSHQSRTYSVTLQGLAGAGETLLGVVTMLHDITREKEIERIKSEFISDVSHELKTPLASIKAYIEMLLDGEATDPQERNRFYQTLADESDRLHRMIERVLNVSRVESGSIRVVREPVSMSAVAQQVMGLVEPQARQKSIDIHQQLPPVYHQVEADYDLLCQAIQNLMTNAIKYTPPGGKVQLRVNVDERRNLAVVEVTDTGIGIPADELPRIFDKFYRVRANAKMAPGTGLGLPLVKFIVEKIHHRTLSVTSQPGEGSTFSFELPLVT